MVLGCSLWRSPARASGRWRSQHRHLRRRHRRPSSPQAQAPRQRVNIGFVEIEDDPRYEPVRAYERIVLKTRATLCRGGARHRRGGGARARAQGGFRLERITVKPRPRLAGAVPRRSSRHGFFPDRRAGGKLQAARRRRRGPRRPSVQRVGAGGSCAARVRREFVHDHPEPRAAYGRPRAIPRLAQNGANCWCSKGHRRPTQRDRRIRAVGAKIRRAHRRSTSTSSRAPIRATASRTIRRSDRHRPRFRCGVRRRRRVRFRPHVPYRMSRAAAGRRLHRSRAVGLALDLGAARRAAGEFALRQEDPAGGTWKAPDWAAWMAVKMIVQSALRTGLRRLRKATRLSSSVTTASTAPRGWRSACGPGTINCARRCCSPHLTRSSPARRSRAFSTAPTNSTHSATTSRKRPVTLNK